MGFNLPLLNRRRRGTALDIYGVLGLKPAFVTDFTNEVYRSGGSATDLASLAGIANLERGGLATMVNSAGELVWNPHNLVKYSEQVENWQLAGILSFGSGSVSNATLSPDNTQTADLITENTAANEHYVVTDTGAAVTIGSVVTARVFVKANGRDWCYVAVSNRSAPAPFPGIAFTNRAAYFNLASESAGTKGSSLTSSSITAVGSGWFELTISAEVVASGQTDIVVGTATGDLGYSYTGDGTSGIYIWGAHLYRSDLGGMAPVPSWARGLSTSDTYLPTTSAARYLKRDGHHVNGVRGMLVEPTAGTNLLLNSETLATQSVTTTAVAHTLSFFGTGTVTLSGTSTDGPLVGTGVGDRVSLTFTPTAGTLTLTVSGTVTRAQLETGSVPTSYIPTSGATVTRLADTNGLPIQSSSLPWPTPNVIGAELVTNGTFDTDTTGWTEYRGVTTSVTGGQVTINNSTTNSGRISQAITCITGKVYEVSADVINVSDSSPDNVASLRVASAANTNTLISQVSIPEAAFSGPETISTVFVAPATTVYVELITNTGADIASVTWDNVSVREIDPLAVSMSMKGNVTRADIGTTDSRLVNWQTGTPSIRVSTNGVVGTGRFEFEQHSGAVFDAVYGPITFPEGINVPFNIASRHGSTFINGAVDGTALTANTTPTALPDLSATDLQLGQSGGPIFIEKFVLWDKDLGDAGIALASVTPPAIDGVPTISGETTDPEVGETLVAVAAPVTGKPTPSTTWQWKRGGANISGATSSSYVLTSDDVGFTITVTQTETNAGGAASATSAATSIVAVIPAGAVQQRDSGYIFDRAGGYIEVRA